MAKSKNSKKPRTLESGRTGLQFYASGADRESYRGEGADIVDWRRRPIPADVYNPCADQLALMEQMQLLLGGRMAERNRKLALAKMHVAKSQAKVAEKLRKKALTRD